MQNRSSPLETSSPCSGECHKTKHAALGTCSTYFLFGNNETKARVGVCVKAPPAEACAKADAHHIVVSLSPTQIQFYRFYYENHDDDSFSHSASRGKYAAASHCVGVSHRRKTCFLNSVSSNIQKRNQERKGGEHRK